jgi:hypothetical protein
VLASLYGCNARLVDRFEGPSGLETSGNNLVIEKSVRIV